jgi:hypothetical protein
MEKNCQELLENIQRTLHECRDNQRTIEICEALDVNKCKNIKFWENTIKSSIPLKVEIKNTVLNNTYSIDYKVNERSLIISSST